MEGVFAFISPCILPMLPVFLAYISADTKQSIHKRFINTLFFVLGFSTIFVLMGATAFSFGSLLNQYKLLLTKLAGVALVFFGFVYLDVININMSSGQRAVKSNGILQNYLFGMSYSFGWTPCLGAFLGSALSLSSVQDTVFSGMALLFTFSLGLGLPFIIFAVAYEKLYFATNFLKRHSQTIKYIGGAVLIAVGVMMVFDLFNAFLGLIA